MRHQIEMELIRQSYHLFIFNYHFSYFALLPCAHKKMIDDCKIGVKSFEI